MDEYDFECMLCGHQFDAESIICGHFIKPDECPKCKAPKDNFITTAQAEQNRRINHDDLMREEL
jgi:rubredoxin